MLKLLDKVTFLLSLIAILSLIGSYAASYINPHTLAFFSLLGLAYPYLLIINILFLAYWILRWKKMAWVELGVLVIGLPIFTSYFGTASTNTNKQQGEISILSYNVRYFDHYNWSNQKNTKTNLLNYLKNFSGDIICLQEAYFKNDKKLQRTISKTLQAYLYQYIHQGLVIASRYPILHKGSLAFENSSSGNCIYCDLQFPQDTLRIYNAYLESFKLGKEERQFMKEISQGFNSEELPEGAKRLTSRLISGNKNRARQAEIVKKQLQQSPHPVVICGDFNDTPISYTYQKIKAGLKDAFIEQGWGLGQTYIGEFPAFRIDYILHSKQLQTIGFQRDMVKFSDHYPIKAQLSCPTKQKK